MNGYIVYEPLTDTCSIDDCCCHVAGLLYRESNLQSTYPVLCELCVGYYLATTADCCLEEVLLRE